MLRLIRSVRYGLQGLTHVACTEANMRWHLLATVLVIVCGVTFQISLIEWALVISCIGVMLALECVNTATERLADQICSEEATLIGQAKDATAAAVLIMSIAAASIGGIIFLPKILMSLS